MSLLINGLFEQSLRYAQKIILGISNICLWLFFFACFDLERKSSLINRLIYAESARHELSIALSTVFIKNC